MKDVREENQEATVLLTMPKNVLHDLQSFMADWFGLGSEYMQNDPAHTVKDVIEEFTNKWKECGEVGVNKMKVLLIETPDQKVLTYINEDTANKLTAQFREETGEYDIDFHQMLNDFLTTMMELNN